METSSLPSEIKERKIIKIKFDELLDLIINNLYYKNIYKFSLFKMVIDYGNKNLFNYLIKKNKILNDEINYFMTNFNFSNQVAIDIDNKFYIKNYIKDNIIKYK